MTIDNAEFFFFIRSMDVFQGQGSLFQSTKIDEQQLTDCGRKMKNASLEQQLLLATIDDQDEGVDVCDSTPDTIVAVSPSSRQRQLIPGRQSSRFACADVCETIPEENHPGSAHENEEEAERLSQLRQQIVDAHPPPRRQRKLLPIQHLSLNIRQVSVKRSKID